MHTRLSFQVFAGTDLTCPALTHFCHCQHVPAGEGNKHVVLVGGLGDGLLLAP